MKIHSSRIVGFSMLAVIALAFSSVFWLQKRQRVASLTPLRIIFEGSVSGLRAGRDVTFNGVKVGDVRSVRLDNPQRIVVLAMVNNATPIRNDTAIRLESQGLTGIVGVALKGGAENAPSPERDGDGVPTLNVDTRAIQDISQSLRTTTQNVKNLLDNNRGAANNSLANIEAFTDTLTKNANRFDGIQTKGQSLMEIVNSDQFMAVWNRVPINKISDEVSRTVVEFKELASNFDKRTAAFSADKRQMEADISRATSNLDRNPARLIFGPSGSQATPASSPLPLTVPITQPRRSSLTR